MTTSRDIAAKILGNARVVPLDPVALRRGDARRPTGDVQIDAKVLSTNPDYGHRDVCDRQ